jgi:peptidoglycan/LPS O-acetylase OafA/YrhL
MAAAAPTHEPHIAALDGLRAVAVTAVFFVHYGAGNHSSSAALRFIAQLSSFGTYGVTLFFLLSGFLITGILWDSRDDHTGSRTSTSAAPCVSFPSTTPP